MNKATTTPENLKREIGPRSLALAGANVMVGSGIFVLPALIAEGVGAAAILAYIVCGLLVVLIALCFAEMGSKTIKSGGSYTYIGNAFGPYPGFLAGNIYLLGCITSDAAMANALADTLQVFQPALRIDFYRILFMMLVFGGLCWLNISSVKNGVRFVVFASITKLVPLIILVLISIPHAETGNLKWTIQPTADNVGAAALLLSFAFLGFETALCNGGEIKNPRRTVPLGVLGGVGLVLLLYVSIQLVTQGVLGSSLAEHKEAPLAAVANVSLGKTGMLLLVGVTAVSILGAMSGEILSVPRVLFAAARNGLMPKALGKVHPRFATPYISILVYTTLCFLLAASGSFKSMAIIASASLLLIYLGVVLATIKSRLKKDKEPIDGFRVPGGIIIPLVASAGITWLLWNSTKPEIIGIAIYIASFTVIYILIRYFRNKETAMKKVLNTVLLIGLFTTGTVAQKQRARDLGIPFDGKPGRYNAITDVPGLEVGYSTLISGSGENVRGKGPVRTGVTAILPRGRSNNPVYANWYALNGNGEMTGTTWITESGFLEGPIMITNTNSVGVVRDAVLKWYVKKGWYKEDFWYTYPVVAETYDGFLNDIYGFHVKEEHAWQALDSAKSGFIKEGNVGGGTGMMCLGFKGGTGTASRIIKIRDSSYTVGVLVQSNFGGKEEFRIAGVPIGKELKDTLNYEFKAPPDYKPGSGSIIVIVATDAPLLPHQLKRVAARVPLGIGIVGGRGENSSGDIFLAFSTANPNAFQRRNFTTLDELPNNYIDPVFYATVQAVEEAIINAMVAAETMEGVNNNKAYGLPHKRVIEILKKYNRIK